MKVLSVADSPEYILEFDSTSEFESFFGEAELRGSFVVSVEHLPPNAVFRARCLDSPRSRRIRPLSLLRLSSGYEIRTSEKPIQPPPGATPSEPAPAEAGPATTASADKPPAPHDGTEVRQSLTDQIRGLPMTERVTLALKADLMERRILAQENNSKINEFLLRNPRISDQEIAFMARSPSSPIQTILAIANHKEWMNRESIRAAVLANPRTPPAMVLDMIPGASSSDLLNMARSRHLRQDVQVALQQEIKKRGLRVKKVAD